MHMQGGWVSSAILELQAKMFNNRSEKLGLVLRHINHRRLFNAKSIFIHINSSISNNSV